MADAQIERYWGIRCLAPALRAIGQSRQNAARQDLVAHRESNIEIHLILDGMVDWIVEGESFSLQPDTIFVTQPFELHGGTRGMVQPSSLLWLQVNPDDLADKALVRQLQSLPSRFAPGALHLKEFVHAMLAECRTPQEESAAIVASNLRLFLLHMLRQFRQADVRVMYPAAMRQMITFIEQNLDESLSVDRLCSQVSLSRSRVFQLFETHVGQSPISYASTLRIQRAKQLLKQSDDTITTIAQSLGFSSSQHFATAFRRGTGITPSAFRNS